MDAPALPPSQRDVPALIATVDDPAITLAAELPLEDLVSPSLASPELASPELASPDLVSSSLASLGDMPGKGLVNVLPKGALSRIRAIEFSLLTPADATRPLGWLPSTQLTHSFGFMSRAFRSAKLENAIRFSRLSATVPIQWARSNDWKSWAKTAQIKVTAVDTHQSQAAATEAWSVPFSQCLVGESRQVVETSIYRLSLKETTLGYVADRDHAYAIAQQLERLIHQADFEANEIVPQRLSTRLSTRSSTLNAVKINAGEMEVGEMKRKEARAEPEMFGISAAERTLFSIRESMAEAVGYSKEWAAVAWANNLRVALDAEPLSAGDTQMTLERMVPSNITLKGDASWYGPYFHGRATANGEVYNQHDLTVAHKSLPFGTHLKVRNLQNDRTVVVRVNDRGPYVGDRSLDLSNAAAKCLGSDEAGVIPYEAVILQRADR